MEWASLFSYSGGKHTLWGHSDECPRQRLARGVWTSPWNPRPGGRAAMRQPKRSVWVKIRARESERAEWHTKARRAGLSLSALVRRAIERTQTWTVAHAEVERTRAAELARIGNNLNQIARWANTHKGGAEAVQVMAHLVALRREIRTFAGVEEPPDDG